MTEYFYAIYDQFDNLVEVFDTFEELVYFFYKITPENKNYKRKCLAIKKRIRQNKNKNIVPNKFKIYKFEI